MTNQPLDLDAVRHRYVTVEAGWVSYPLQPGESEVEYRERVEPALADDAYVSAMDVPLLIAEIEQLQALQRGFERSMQDMTDLRLQLVAAKVKVQELQELLATVSCPGGCELHPINSDDLESHPGPSGVIDMNRDGNWVLTCSDCGTVGTYPMMEIVGQSEPEKAWDRHLVDKHPGQTCGCPRCQS